MEYTDMQKQIPKGTLLLIGGAEDKGKLTVLDIEGKNKQFEEFENGKRSRRKKPKKTAKKRVKK